MEGRFGGVFAIKYTMDFSDAFVPGAARNHNIHERLFSTYKSPGGRFDSMASLVNENAIKASYCNANAKQIQAIYPFERTILNA